VKNLKEIMISADDEAMYTFRVTVDRDGWNVKLGNKWNILCKNNNFKDGDMIHFKFDKEIRCHCWNKVGLI
jgi:hypothetical protein